LGTELGEVVRTGWEKRDGDGVPKDVLDLFK
jgi:hypothetical protein